MILDILSVILKSFPVSVQSLSCVELCNPMNHSTPGLPVHHQLPELTQTHVQPFILWYPLLPSVFPSIRVFSMSQLFASGGQSIGVSASASVLPMNTQDSSLLGWTGWISLQSKGLARVFSNTTAQKHQYFSAHFSYSPTLTSIPDH